MKSRKVTGNRAHRKDKFRMHLIQVKQDGFTLMEMIIVLAILSLTSFVAIGSMTSFKTYEFLKFANQVEQMVQQAQQNAVLKNNTYEIAYKYDKGKGAMQSIKETFIEESLDVPEGVTVLIGSKDHYQEGDFVPQSSGGRIKFAKDMSPSKGGTITLQRKGINGKIQITIRPVTGKTTLYKRLK